jgi:Neurochondrin
VAEKFMHCFTFSSCGDLEEKVMVADVYEIMTAIVSSDGGRTAVVDMQTVTALCQAIVTKCYGMPGVIMEFV